MKTDLEILVAARELISTPQKWIKGYLAKDSKGSKVLVTDPSAVCFCAVGAVRWVGDLRSKDVDAHLVAQFRAIEKLSNALPRGTWGRSVVAFQDDAKTTHAQVLAVFDRAIEQAKREEVTYG